MYAVGRRFHPTGRECHYAWDGDCILPRGRVSSPTVREGSNRLAMLRLSPPPYVAAFVRLSLFSD